MKSSDSGSGGGHSERSSASEQHPEAHAQAARRGISGHISRLSEGRVAAALMRNAEVGLYILYSASILVLLACYFLDIPADRLQFYRRSMAVWKASFDYARRGMFGGTAQPSTAGPQPGLSIPAGQPVVGYLDRATGQPVITAAEGEKVRVSGWAGCRDLSSPLAKIEILVDGQPKATAALSFPRPDVAEAFRRPDFYNSGWQASFTVQGLKAGTAPITARATCAAGETGTLPPFQLIVKGK